MWHLVNALCQRMSGAGSILRRIEILTIESRAINGPGFPYDMDGISPYHLCNNPAEKMSLFDNDFVDWMLENHRYITERYPELIRQSDPAVPLSQWQPHPEKFYPRVLFGIYLSMRFNQEEKRRQSSLTCYVHGMGPSGIDAILSLCEHGHFTYDTDGLATSFEPDWSAFQASEVKIIAGSRSGFFPGVRWPLLNQEFWYLTEAQIDTIKENNRGEIPLDELLSLIDSELQRASDNELGFENVLKPDFSDAHQKLLTDIQGTFSEQLLHTVILHARRLKFYQDLNAVDKCRYDKELDTHFIRTAVPIPLQNARKLISLIKAGVLSTIQLGYQKELNQFFEFDYLGTIIKPDTVICSHGQNYDVRRHPSLLVKNLIENQEVIEYSENGYRPGGICADESTHFRVATNTKGYRDQSWHLYSFGPVTQYWQNQNNYTAAFVNALTIPFIVFRTTPTAKAIHATYWYRSENSVSTSSGTTVSSSTEIQPISGIRGWIVISVTKATDSEILLPYSGNAGRTICRMPNMLTL